MIANVGAVVFGLAGEYILPFLVEEATRYAARRVISSRLSATSYVPVGPRALALVQKSTSNIVVSDLPGRLRLRVTSGRPLADMPLVLTALQSLPGVIHASGNPLTGNALVRYDPDTVGVARIVATVESLHGPARSSLARANQRSGGRPLALLAT